MRKMNLKNNMKAVALAIVTAALLTGCGSAKEAKPTDNKKAEVTETVLNEENANVEAEEEAVIETRLETTETYDPFENIEISFVGLTSDVSVNLDHITPSEEDSWIYYTVATESGRMRVFKKDSSDFRDYSTFSVKNGDTLTFTAEIIDCSGHDDYEVGQPNGEPGFITKFGKTLARTTFEYVVEGVDSYVNEASEIGDGLKEELDTFSKGILQADFDSWGEDEKIIEMKLVDIGVKSFDHTVVFEYEVNATNAEAESFTYYWSVYFSNFHCAGDKTSYVYYVPRGTEGVGDPGSTMSGYYECYTACNDSYTPAGQQWHTYFGYESIEALRERFGL